MPANLLVGRGADVALGLAMLLDGFDSVVRLGLDLATRSRAGVGFSSTIGAGSRAAANMNPATKRKKKTRFMP